MKNEFQNTKSLYKFIFACKKPNKTNLLVKNLVLFNFINIDITTYLLFDKLKASYLLKLPTNVIFNSFEF